MMVEYVCIAVPSVDLDTSLIHTDYIPSERVVRCRDCVFTEEEGRFCNFFTDESVEISIPASVEPDGFCAWGKPMKEDSWPRR